jgi:hypothetical protein
MGSQLDFRLLQLIGMRCNLAQVGTFVPLYYTSYLL